jgi:hypothetical protein
MKYQKTKFVVLLFCLGLLVGINFSCKSDNGSPAEQTYDPSIPISVTNLMPDSGGIRTQFIIEGSNFGTDPSKIHVTFDNDSAVILGSTGTYIYGLVPKEPGGNNEVKVFVDKSDTVKAGYFAYTPAELVSTVTGKGGTSGLVDGTLAGARFGTIGGIGVLSDNLLLVCEYSTTNIRLVSIDENAVTTLSNGINGSEPSVLDDKSAAYLVDHSNAGNIPVYIFRKKNLWSPQKIANNVSFDNGDKTKGVIYTTCLDNTQKYLYFLSSYGEFGRISLDNPTHGQLLNNTSIPATNNFVSMRYNRIDGNFYASVQGRDQIYQIIPPINRESSDKNDWMNINAYAGTSSAGGTDGPKDNATFYNPAGIDIDSKGNIYVVDSYSMIIREIELSTGLVSTIAGIYSPNSAANVDGEPLKARFNWPYVINHDSEDNFFIGEKWGCDIRELAIQ